ncbi:MAG: DUF1054 family protein [Anaeromyxobacteraceae bacterium]
MAGLGIGPEDFAIFDIGDPDDRADAIDAVLGPKLRSMGEQLGSGLSRVTAAPLQVQLVKAQRRKGVPPPEALVAFCASDKGWQKAPYLAIGASREHLHARVGAKPAADRDGALRRALEREAANLAKKGKPFRKLRPFMDWDGEELPEIAPAHLAAFWQELADELQPARPGVDVGVTWSAEEARSLAIGDVLGVFRDLAPLFKLLAHAGDAAARVGPPV